MKGNTLRIYLGVLCLSEQNAKKKNQKHNPMCQKAMPAWSGLGNLKLKTAD